jgi:acetyltransferase-like isoleucine patch superfamily enzyme
LAKRLLILGADGHARAIADVAVLGGGAAVLPGLTVGKKARVPAAAVVPGNIQPSGRTAR